MGRLLTTVDVQVEAFIAETLFANDEISPAAAVCEAVLAFPNTSVLSLIFGVVSCAAALEDPVLLPNDRQKRFPTELFRCSAALSADLYGMHLLGFSHPSCGELLHFWDISKDDFFRTDQT